MFELPLKLTRHRLSKSVAELPKRKTLLSRGTQDRSMDYSPLSQQTFYEGKISPHLMQPKLAVLVPVTNYLK